jgi:hypothetical protein
MNLIDSLLESLTRYLKAQQEHDEEKAKGSRDWGYFGNEYIDKVQDARHYFEIDLSEFIKNEVEKVLSERGVTPVTER